MPVCGRAGGGFARERDCPGDFLLSLSRTLPGRGLYRRQGETGGGSALPLVAPLDGRDGHRWLFAPRGEMLAEFLTRARRGERFSTGLAITTPTHMSRLV
jgi:hypothetical protein